MYPHGINEQDCISEIYSLIIYRSCNEKSTVAQIHSLAVVVLPDPRNGPAHDTALFVSFIKEYDIPQKLALLCLNAKEVSVTILKQLPIR